MINKTATLFLTAIRFWFIRRFLLLFRTDDMFRIEPYTGFQLGDTARFLKQGNARHIGKGWFLKLQADEKA